MSFLSQSFRRTPVYESEADRIQHEIDNFTHKLEQQRRQNAALDDQYPALIKQVEGKRETLQTSLPTIKDEKKFEIRIKTLKNNVEKETKTLNSIRAKNESLRQHIDTLRRERKAYNQMFHVMHNELVNASNTAEKCNTTSKKAQSVEERNKRKIIGIKQKAEDELNMINSQLSMMKSTMDDDAKRQKLALREIDASLQSANTKLGRDDQIDPNASLEELKGKWLKACIDKKKNIEKHQKNIKILSDAFHQIQEATGIDEIDEIVIGLIKSEEQHYNLYSYVNALNTELDGLEERNLLLQKQHGQSKEIFDSQRSETIANVAKLNQNFEDLENDLQNTIMELNQYKNDIGTLKTPVDDMINQFRNQLPASQHPPPALEDELIEEDFTQLSEQNVERYLSQLDKFINAFLRIESKPTEGIAKPEVQVDPRPNELLQQMINSDDILEEGNWVEYAPFSRRELEHRGVELYHKKLKGEQVED